MTGFLNRSLLVTRPIIDSVEITKQLDRENKTVNIIFGPLFEIKALPINISTSHFQAIVVTSANAVRSLKRSNIAFKGPMYCIGEATAKVAKREGFSPLNANGNSIDLITMIINNANKKKDKMVYFRGEEVFSDLAGSLRELGYQVDEAVCYKKEKLNLDKSIIEGIKDEKILGATFFSRQTVDLFFEQLNTVPDKFISFCISDEVSKAYKSHNDGPSIDIRISKSPNLREMCKLIIEAPEFAG